MVEMMSLCSAVHHALPVRIVRSPWNVYNMFQKCIKLDTEMYWVTCTGRVTCMYVYVHVHGTCRDTCRDSRVSILLHVRVHLYYL